MKNLPEVLGALFLIVLGIFGGYVVRGYVESSRAAAAQDHTERLADIEQQVLVGQLGAALPGISADGKSGYQRTRVSGLTREGADVTILEVATRNECLGHVSFSFSRAAVNMAKLFCHPPADPGRLFLNGKLQQ